MTVATLSVVLTAVGVIAAADFLLSLAVIRRLRVQAAQRAEEAGIDVPATGHRVPELELETIAGDQIDHEFYGGRSVVLGFFSPDCPACERLKSDLQREPLSQPLLAFVRLPSQGQRENPALIEGLQNAGAQIVRYRQGDAVAEGFAVRAFPTLLRVEDGVTVAAGFRRRDIETPPSGSLLGRRRRVLARALG